METNHSFFTPYKKEIKILAILLLILFLLSFFYANYSNSSIKEAERAYSEDRVVLTGATAAAFLNSLNNPKN